MNPCRIRSEPGINQEAGGRGWGAAACPAPALPALGTRGRSAAGRL